MIMRWFTAALLALLAIPALAGNPTEDTYILRGATSGLITLKPQAIAGTWNWNFPTSAGSSGQVATSGGGVAAPMTWTTLATVATSGSAADLGSGALPAARLPALTGDVTSSAGSAATTLAAGSAANLNSGTLAAGRLPALTGDVTTSAGSAATTLAAGSATNLNSGTLNAARLPTITNQKCVTWDSTLAVVAQTIEYPVEWATFTVTGMKSAVSGGGSFTVNAKIASTSITSLSAVSVSGTSNAVTAATGANTGVANDQISIVVSAPSGTVNQAYVCLVFTHSVN